MLSTYLTNSLPTESDKAEDAQTPSFSIQNQFIKLKQVNQVHTGYSSDEEDDSDGQNHQSFLGNKNSNYYKTKNVVHIPSRYQLGIDRDHKLKKKFDNEPDDKLVEEKEEDSGYDEG